MWLANYLLHVCHDRNLMPKGGEDLHALLAYPVPVQTLCALQD